MRMPLAPSRTQGHVHQQLSQLMQRRQELWEKVVSIRSCVREEKRTVPHKPAVLR